MPISRLISADGYRDGGSLEVVFRLQNGLIDAVCLKANIFALDGIGERFTELYWFRNEADEFRPFMNSLSKDVLVLPNSEAERELLGSLIQFLAHPVLEPIKGATSGVDHRIAVLGAMVEGIPNRRHFDAIKHQDALALWKKRLTSR
jgi:hypothetical protein